MPVWHERTRESRASGKLRIVGLVQDQHADRAGLFMQWKQFEWPVLVDSLNRTGARVVPLIWLLDEHGIVRAVNPRPADLAELVARVYPAPTGQRPAEAGPPKGSAAAARAEGDRLFLGGGTLSAAVAAYEKAISLDAKDAESRFRLGVALRRRFESSERQPGDFRRAAAAWTEALEHDPGQYVWRRRIQQYGPRLGKPYNFFGWVRKARRAIAARGDRPVELGVEPSWTEKAGPMHSMFPPPPSPNHPLPPYNAPNEYPVPTIEPPRGPWTADRARLLDVEVVTVPTRIAPGRACKIHVILRAPDPGKARIVPELEVRIARPEDWRQEPAYFPLRSFGTSPSTVSLTAEFELHAPRDAQPGPVKIPIRVRFAARTGTDGRAVPMRRELEATVMIRPEPPRKRRR